MTPGCGLSVPYVRLGRVLRRSGKGQENIKRLEKKRDYYQALN